MTAHFADCWELIADQVPDHLAIVQGERALTWGDYEDRAARLSSLFEAYDLGPGRHVGMFMYNCPEYLETQFAAFKMGATPVNVNYRYLDDELTYLIDNADITALVYHTSLGDRVARIRHHLPRLELLIEVDDSAIVGIAATSHVEGAIAYEDVIAQHDPAPRHERDPDAVYMLYTGGTTGLPKGVMYRTGSFSSAWFTFAAQNLGREPWETSEEMAAWAADQVRSGAATRVCPGPPLMHGTGVWLGAMLPHVTGNTCVLLPSRSLVAAEVVAEAEVGLSMLVIVGDAFAKPILTALDARRDEGRPADLSRFLSILSSGAMLSADTKERLFEHAPHLLIVDALGSTEGSMGSRVSMGSGSGTTAKFQPTPGTKVFDELDREIEPGSGEVGWVAATGGFLPYGYYKDPEKSARTFRTIEGVPYSFPGDMATVEADGSITLMGRGSACINSGGEKVFPEEVEEAIKTHPAIVDCLVFGVADELLGQSVTAIASVNDTVTSEELIAHCKSIIAGYKAPKRVRLVDAVPRSPSGKADYGTARSLFDASPAAR